MSQIEQKEKYIQTCQKMEVLKIVLYKLNNSVKT